ncbi:D-alanine-D-alanine ligase [Geoalkalibacter ferrihydriticus]|uniref:D-alanine-D-alanine ligase n=1 Tax=Geoalkalibacter ferrihydriticus TaxID=392333 RepID=A0A1G9TJK1_9BACT|nr:ATP-grasp domain-containing protein [Geoalkalibacter ferrihydriticus]SDM47335.1 D-alanine-D-alanine ligase [Geoalkalibacter ferrihydriticus]
MKVAVSFNRVPPLLVQGEALDRISEEGAEAEAQAVAAALRALGHAPQLVALGDDIAPFVGALRAAAPALVFNLCEGFWGQSRKEMHVAALLDLLGLAFTGAAPLCLGLTQDKARTKDLLSRHQLPTPKYLLVKLGEQYPRVRDLAYPLIVKPRFEDASLGISNESVVDNERELKARIDYVHRTYRQGALVEEFIEGREINVAVIGNGPHEVLPLSEIRFHSDLVRPIVSYEGKWLEQSQGYQGTQPLCPANLKGRDAILVRDVALRAYKVMECRDYARVDIRLRDGVPYILEVNANPDISPDAGLARCAGVAGMTYPQLIRRVLEMAAQRREVARA